MTTLLLRLSGPMQSWGTHSKFDVRETGYEPSKSGVIGLLCAALGRPRHDSLDDLAALQMGVRVDCQGTLQRDFHTAGKDGYYKVSGKIERKNPIVTTRYYLADAVFLVGLSGEVSLLQDLFHALQHPVWLLYLGRKAFVPSEPVWLPDGLRYGESLMDALRTYPWLGHTDDPPARLRVVYDDPNGPLLSYDHPVSFAERTFRPRYTSVESVPAPARAEEG